MASDSLTLVSFDLCPYVQRAAITLMEKSVPFERKTIDLANKPAWFTAISPLGKVPLLLVGDTVIFESAVIVEYLEETQGHPLHPQDPLHRARHRAWIQMASAILSDIWVIETTSDEAAFADKCARLRTAFQRIETELGYGPYFSGSEFSLVDASFAPVFRYFDVFDRLVDLRIFDGLEKVQTWRRALAVRPSVIDAVVTDYSDRLMQFLRRYDGVIMRESAHTMS